jgi:hypothetical protein
MRRLRLLAIAIVPALVVVVLALAQARTFDTLHAPAAGSRGAGRALGAVAQLSGQLSHVNGDRSHAVSYAWIAAAILVVLALMFAVLWPLGPREPALGARARGGRAGGTAGRADGELDDGLDRDRARLIQTCVEIADRTSNASLRRRLLRALGDVGVTEIRVAEGTPFDPRIHRGTGSAATADPALERTVAGMQRAGYADRGRRLRPPDVVVYATRPGGDERSDEPADEPADERSDEPADERSDERPDEPADERPGEPADECSDEPAGEPAGEPADG